MLLVLLLCYPGFAALCLSMGRHHRDWLGQAASPRRRFGLRLLGWTLLVLSPWPAVSRDGWGLGLVQWCALLMFSGLLLVLLLPYRPRLALALAVLGLLSAPVALAVLS